MLWVHVPYTKHKNDLVSIQEEICSQYHYDYDDYFNAYQNKKINYIVKVKNKKKTMYVVCNKKLKKVDTFEGKTISKKEVKNAFVQKYQSYSFFLLLELLYFLKVFLQNDLNISLHFY